MVGNPLAPAVPSGVRDALSCQVSCEPFPASFNIPREKEWGVGDLKSFRVQTVKADGQGGEG